MFQNPKTTTLGYIALGITAASYVVQSLQAHGPGMVTFTQVLGILIGLAGIFSKDGAH